MILLVLAATVGLFVWGRWRHDLVALAALLACVALGLVGQGEAFSGFGHPAVITVVCVLVLGVGLKGAGAIDVVVKRLMPASAPPSIALIVLLTLAAGLSAFMNNVGALALLMPVGIKLAERQGLPPGKVLMPLSFASILGGMTTLIGTPPNLIVAGFREELGGLSFAMFDFTPVGVAVAGAGLVATLLLGRWLVPARQRDAGAGFVTGQYLTEARVPEASDAVGMTLAQVEEALSEADALVIGLIRGERRMPAPNRYREVRDGDILLLRAEPEKLGDALGALGLELGEAVVDERGEIDEKGKVLKSDEIELTELAVLPNAELTGRSATDISLRTRYGLNLLAVSRQGRSPVGRLRDIRLTTGDVLLMQGTAAAIAEFAARYGCVPLAERALNLAQSRRALTAAVVLLAAIGLTVSGLAAPATAFAAGVLTYLVLGVVSVREVYHTIDWPVIVLLGALIPVAGAMESTGAADLVASFLLDTFAQGRPVIALIVILVLSMTLSDLMNNAATAAVMCPIAIGTAAQLNASADPFLMAVAVGASCAFLTPIGHQNNTLILGPGGFRFGDYWRLGLPLELIVIAVAVPTILMVWPLGV
ncbi:MAG TPA: SLC13 family permease [Gammaproteobacteria bacterium]|nr:SLC13 family permease [Gammaproteobacteria bacterium]